jgi:hypothetical protein
VAVGVALDVPLIGVPPSPVSMPVSVGVGVGLTEPVPVGVAVGVAVGVGDVAVAVGFGDVVVGVAVGDVALVDGVADPVADEPGLAVAEDAAAHDGDDVGDGVGDSGDDGIRSAPAFEADGVDETAWSAVFAETRTLVQSTMRVAGQLAEGAGLAGTALRDAGAPRPGVAP